MANRKIFVPTVSLNKVENIEIDLDNDDLLDEFGKTTLMERYLISGETSPQHALARASCAFADDKAHAQYLYDAASKLWFMFATPLLSNGGTSRGMPISCFLNNVEDSRGGILDHYTENGWLASMGGGIGTYWGNLRSLGTRTSQGSKTSGVVPFAKVVDTEMLAFSQGDTRRGSAAVWLDVSHPEIEEWIVMRKMTGGDPNRKTPNLHNGVVLTDAFMHAVVLGEPFDLIDPHSKKVAKTVQARDLLRLILDVRMETGEPYIFFKDAANQAFPQQLKDRGLEIKHTNLCTEIMLGTGRDNSDMMRTAVCCLSSVNLAKYDEWKDDPMFIENLMRMLDNTLTYYIENAPPSHAYAVYSAKSERSVGLGAMGLHTYMQEHNIAFASEIARATNIMMFQQIDSQSLAASKVLAKERGEAPDMKGSGLRFAHRMAVAPNATSSIICGGVSPSIEPIRGNGYLHKTLSGSFPIKNPTLEKVLENLGLNTKQVWDQIILDKGSVRNIDGLTDHIKDVFKTALEIDQNIVIQLAADRQKYIDQAQSINLFFPADAQAQDIYDTHMLAWRGRIKSLYYMRSEAVNRADLVGLSKERAVVQPAPEECVACEG